MRIPLALATLALLAGCLGGTTTDDDGTAPGDGSGTLDPALRPVLKVPTFLPPIELGVVLTGAEPSVAIAPDGTVYVTTPLALWRSDDNGTTFAPLGTAVCPGGVPTCPGLEEYDPGLVGGGDASLAVTADGTVHWAGLGGGIPYQRSTDKGVTWSAELDVSNGTGSDREWVVVDRDSGALYVQWRGTMEGDAAIGMVASHDAGLTWGNLSRVADDGRQGPIAPDPTSPWMLLPHTLGGQLFVARSQDDGATWEDATVGPVNGRPYIFPISVFDGNGTAYFVWAEDPDAPSQLDGAAEASRLVAVPSVYLSVSHDKGVTWSAPLMLSTPGVPAIFPWIDAGAAGRVAVSWYEGQQPVPANRLPNVFDVKVAVSVSADQAVPEFAVAQVNVDPVHLGAFCTEGLMCTLSGGDRSMLDFFEIRVHPDGGAVVAWAADDTVKMGRVKVFASRTTDATPLL